MRTSDHHMVPEASRTRKVVTMVACLYLHMGFFGMYVALGDIHLELVAYLDAPRAEVALVQSLNVGFSLGGGLLFTKLVTKYDAGVVIAAASFVATISFCAGAFSPNLHIVMVLIGGVTGLAFSINYLAAFVVISWTFQKNRKFALAILTIGSTLGEVILPYVATMLIEEYLWTGAVLILGTFLYLNCIPCGILIHFSEPYFNKGDINKIKQSKCVDVTCLSDLPFMIFLITCLTFNAINPVERWFVEDMSVLKGFSSDAGAKLLFVNGLCGIFARCIATLALGFLPNLRQEFHIAYAFLTLAIAHVTVSKSPVYSGMVLGIILRGLSSGIIVAFLPGLQIGIRGIENYPTTASITNFLNGIGSILGGFLGWLSFDVTKGYDLLFVFASCVSTYNALSMLLIFVIRRTRHNYEKI